MCCGGRIVYSHSCYDSEDRADVIAWIERDEERFREARGSHAKTVSTLGICGGDGVVRYAAMAKDAPDALGGGITNEHKLVGY